jgi:MFS family permease
MESTDKATEPAIPAAQADAEADYDRFVARNLPRNYLSHFIHGMLGMTGFRLVNAPTFVPAYLHLISGSETVVGIALALQQLGGVVSQIWAANFIEHRKKLMPVAIWLGIGMRVPIVGMAIAGWVLSGTPLLLTFLFCLFMLGLFSGPQRVTFQSLLAKVIPVNYRGRLQAWRNMTGGLIAALLSYGAGRYLIGNNVLGNGYATTFLLAFALTSLGLMVLQFLMREPEPPNVRPQTAMSERLRDFPALLTGDRNFRDYMWVLCLANAGRIAGPFYIVYASSVIELDGANIGLLSLAYLGADTLTNLAWGYLGDRRGFRPVLLGALGLWAIATILLISSHAPALLFTAFFALGAAQCGYQMASQTMVLEFGDRQDIAMRLALTGTVEGALSAIAPVVGGLIAVGFSLTPVFALSILFELGAFFILLMRVNEPRMR